MTKSDTLARAVFKASYFLGRKGAVLKHYKEFMKTQWWPYERLLDFQVQQLGKLMGFVYRNVPYFREVFDSHGLKPRDISSIQALQALPIMTKRLIREHREEMTPRNIAKHKCVRGSTGGSTGEPLRYVISSEDLTRGIALLHRGWSYGAYEQGDRMAIIAGSSMIPGTRSTIRKSLISKLRNVRYYSSYGISEKTLFHYVETLNEFKPMFLRGYSSSLFALASFIRQRNVDLLFRPRAVFSTAEKLLNSQRRVITDVFEADVFDNYGLNDGGVSAYECEEHSGMHIDMERAILEVVNEKGETIQNQAGRILATSLFNYGFPFVRYDTGDIGVVRESQCSCGRRLPVLKEITGRTTDLLELNGRKIGSPVLTVLFGKFDIKQYQIVQESNSALTCRIVKGREYTQNDEEFIRKSLTSHLGPAGIEFEYVSAINPWEGNKHKFIIDRRGDTFLKE